ncbi:MAG: NUDIX hydrolase [Trebonia sp.]
MTGYRKGTTSRGELEAIREHLAQLGAAVQASPDVLEAYSAVSELGELGARIVKEAADARAWLVGYLHYERRIPQDALAQMLSMSTGRVGQLARAGRKLEGNPIMDPGTLEIMPAVALAIVTSPEGVLIARRIDRTPEWTFPGGEVMVGEKPADALVRRVLAETGVMIRPDTIFGQRIHPRTGRHMIYMACTVLPDSPAPRLLDTEDLDAVEFAGLDVVRDRMPDMYPPVREHLGAVLGNVGRF